MARWLKGDVTVDMMVLPNMFLLSNSGSLLECLNVKSRGRVDVVLILIITLGMFHLEDIEQF